MVLNLHRREAIMSVEQLLPVLLTVNQNEGCWPLYVWIYPGFVEGMSDEFRNSSPALITVKSTSYVQIMQKLKSPGS